MSIGALTSTTNLYASVTAGLQQTQARVAQDAQTVASKGPDVGAIVDLNTNALAFKAQTKVASAVDQTTKRLLDITA